MNRLTSSGPFRNRDSAPRKQYRKTGATLRRTITMVAMSGVPASATTVAGPASAARTEPSPGTPPSEHATATSPRRKDPDAGPRAAAAEARKRKRPVEVPGVATEISRSRPFPDGHITTDTYTAPARGKQADGSWPWSDNSLTEHDGALRPGVSGAKVTVELSGGGHNRPFASTRVADKGQEPALICPKTLPRPTVGENIVTYEDAAGTPGADLVVTALTTGFRLDVVPRERPKGT